MQDCARNHQALFIPLEYCQPLIGFVKQPTCLSNRLRDLCYLVKFSGKLEIFQAVMRS